MLALDDVIELPDGVVRDGDGLFDGVRARHYPGNPAARVILEGAGASIAEAAAALSSRFSISPERARHDALAFVWDLNRALLVNVERRGRRLLRLRQWVGLAARLAPAGALPPTISRRRALDTSSRCRAALTCALGLGGRGLALACGVAAGTAHLSAIAGAVAPAVAVVAGLATGIALLLHEAAHAVAVSPAAAAVVTSGPRTFVLHRGGGGARAAVVAFVGPALPAGVGLVLATVAVVTANDLLAVGACPFAAHALSLTAFSSDGRAVCDL